MKKSVRSTSIRLIGFGSVIFIVVTFFVFRASSKQTCDTIFEQSADRLTGNIELVKLKGSLILSKDRIQELTEAAQVTAVNLKACCILTNEGLLSSEDFLECKQVYREQGQQFDELLEAIQTASESAKGTNTKNIPEDNRANIEQLSSLIKQGPNRIVSKYAAGGSDVTDNSSAEEAEETGVVGEVGEIEPNNNFPQATPIVMNQAMSGKSSEDDRDYFLLSYPDLPADVLSVEISNRGRMGKPLIQIFDDKRSLVKEKLGSTGGQDLASSFLAETNTDYFILYKNQSTDKASEYKLKVLPENKYDQFDPNESIFDSKSIETNKTYRLQITHLDDADFYKFYPSKSASNLEVEVISQSESLRPGIALFGPDKTHLGETVSNNFGQDIKHKFETDGSPFYFIKIFQYVYGNGGEYDLTISELQ